MDILQETYQILVQKGIKDKFRDIDINMLRYKSDCDNIAFIPTPGYPIADDSNQVNSTGLQMISCWNSNTKGQEILNWIINTLINLESEDMEEYKVFSYTLQNRPYYLGTEKQYNRTLMTSNLIISYNEEV